MDLVHKEMHTQIKYVVAHGISSTVKDKEVLIGSAHFVFEDEGCEIPTEEKEKFDAISPQYTQLYLAIDKTLSAVITIEDPLKSEAKEAIKALKANGFDKIVMMTGDNRRTAAAIANAVGVDEFYAEVLPEDKARFVESEKASGRKVIMVGDGINDSPALSASDAGIAVSDGAAIAREIADITIASDDLFGLVTLKQISNGMSRRIQRNYRMIVGINSLLIVFGLTGIMQPTTSALLHNTSTLLLSADSMRNLLTENGKTA